jgi:hypothetical protein
MKAEFADFKVNIELQDFSVAFHSCGFDHLLTTSLLLVYITEGVRDVTFPTLLDYSLICFPRSS